jgi:hypothetical protein
MISVTAAAQEPKLGLAGKLGAGLFAVWGVLHVWVGVEGTRQYLTGGTAALMRMFLGGRNAPVDGYQHATDALTANVHGHLALNFVLDVGAAGLLGFAVAWMLWRQASWTGYFIGLVVIGVIDNAFLFTQVVPGIIVFGAETLGGPLLWALACVLTPFGLPRPAGGTLTPRGEARPGASAP